MSKGLNFAFVRRSLSLASSNGRGYARYIRPYSSATATTTTPIAINQRNPFETKPRSPTIILNPNASDKTSVTPATLTQYPPSCLQKPKKPSKKSIYMKPKPVEEEEPERTPLPASGGVPEPTREYLSVAAQPPVLLPEPRTLLVVIDMNGTLLHRPRRKDPTHFVERPYARAFLSYCVNTFKVVVWSSAQPKNVKKICKKLLNKSDHNKLVAVWGRDRFGLHSDDYMRKVQCYKRLKTLWMNATVAESHPLFVNGGKWSQMDTVLVDDSAEKGRSEPHNLVQLPEFGGDVLESGCILPQVHDYLNACSQQANVSAYIRENPFVLKPDFTIPS